MTFGGTLLVDGPARRSAIGVRGARLHAVQSLI
jgi:hypothetical protein